MSKTKYNKPSNTQVFTQKVNITPPVVPSVAAPNKENLYLIFSEKWTMGDVAIFYKENAMGYTADLDEAGRFSKEEAEQYVHNNQEARIIAAADVHALPTVKKIVEPGDIRGFLNK